ncbi:unnamed protein product [Phytomonas sp. Hart1]|nr:unnamed protein product [Phytomonas sp. Hart1]|eukprot:CCW69069.1 unnamed protein product [Phytomonas sp. isolate Hart1]
MSLSVLCDGIYFTHLPQDNVITLTWKNDPTQRFMPCTFLIFKVKSTAPHKFHIHPCFGTILLSDSSVSSHATHTFHNGIVNKKEAKIVIGLQEKYSPKAHNGCGDETSTQKTSSNSNTPKRYQERFVIESLIITQNMQEFQKILDSLHDNSKLSHLVKKMWSLISSNAIPSTHIQTCNAIDLKVYMENVVMRDVDASKFGNESLTAVVVPQSAVLVPSSLKQQSKSQASSSSTNYASEFENRTNGIHGANVSPLAPMSDELRALKNEVAILRKMKVYDTSWSTSSVHRGNCNTKHPPALNGIGDRNPTPTSSLFQSGHIKNSKIYSDQRGMDILLSTPLLGSDTHNGVTKHHGLKLYILLGGMFFVYILGLFIQRSRTRPQL